MTGNDIVDLLLAETESNWQRKGWLGKLFGKEEQEIIMQSADKEKMVWLLWSMKESAYKISNRSSGIMSFAPKKIICHLHNVNDTEASGTVYFEDNIYFTHSEISNDYIHTIALTENNFTARNVYIITEKDNQFHALRDYSFLKDNRGIPFLKHISGKIWEVSKSHHGRYEAVVF
jgi:hypothetical protein